MALRCGMRTRTEQDAAYLALKQQLAAILVAESDGWTQVWAAARMGARQGSVSDLRRGKLDRLSLEWLIKATHALGYDITIIATPSPPPPRTSADQRGADRSAEKAASEI